MAGKSDKAIFDSLEDFCDEVSHDGRLLALDVGMKRSGYALSNRARHVVMMAGEIEWKSLADFISILGGMIAEKNIMGLVLGWPRHMNGDEGKNCRVVRRLAHQLSGHQATARPILFWDERLSTKAVERAAEGDIGRNLPLDGAAASYILQGCLDAIEAREHF